MSPFYSKVVYSKKAPFSIATTPRSREGSYSFPWIAPLYPWYILYIAECESRRYQVLFLKSLVWRDLELNLGLPDHWRTLYNVYAVLNNKQLSLIKWICWLLANLVLRQINMSEEHHRHVTQYIFRIDYCPIELTCRIQAVGWMSLNDEHFWRYFERIKKR